MVDYSKSGVDPEVGGFTLLPKGIYRFRVVDANVIQNDYGTSWPLDLEIMEGDQTGGRVTFFLSFPRDTNPVQTDPDFTKKKKAIGRFRHNYEVALKLSYQIAGAELDPTNIGHAMTAVDRIVYAQVEHQERNGKVWPKIWNLDPDKGPIESQGFGSTPPKEDGAIPF